MCGDAGPRYTARSQTGSRETIQATLTEIWRYPVSSMDGERVGHGEIGAAGLAGDRMVSLYDVETGAPAAPGREKRWRPATAVYSRYRLGRAEVTLDRLTWVSGADAAPLLSAHFGFAVELRERGRPDAPQLYHRAPLHLVTTASLRRLRALLPDAAIDVRRFRANLVVDLHADDDFIEQGWIGREIRIGPTRLKVRAPCVRCAYISLGHAPDLDFDKRVGAVVSQMAGGHLGVYCDVVERGTLREGDRVEIDANSPRESA